MPAVEASEMHGPLLKAYAPPARYFYCSVACCGWVAVWQSGMWERGLTPLTPVDGYSPTLRQRPWQYRVGAVLKDLLCAMACSCTLSGRLATSPAVRDEAWRMSQSLCAVSVILCAPGVRQSLCTLPPISLLSLLAPHVLVPTPSPLPPARAHPLDVLRAWCVRQAAILHEYPHPCRINAVHASVSGSIFMACQVCVASIHIASQAVCGCGGGGGQNLDGRVRFGARAHGARAHGARAHGARAHGTRAHGARAHCDGKLAPGALPLHGGSR